jgi:hypothetical protein
VLTAQAFAAVTEDSLTERGPDPATASFLARVRRAGEEGFVYDAAGRLVTEPGTAGAGRGGGPGGEDSARPSGHFLGRSTR